jgi:flagellar FliL protein
VKGNVLKIVLGVVLVMVVAGAAAAGVYFFLNRKPGGAEQKTVKPGLFSAGDFTTNLMPDDSKTKFIRVKVEIEISDEKKLPDVAQKQAVIRDQILAVLRSKAAEDVLGESGMGTLARDIAFALGQVLPGIEILNVYFTDFVVQ